MKREVDGVMKPVRRRYTDNGLLRALEKRWPWDGRYDADRIRQAASHHPSEFEKDTSAQDLYDIFQTQLLPAAETIRTVTSYQDPRSNTRLEIERILFNDGKSGFSPGDNQFKLSLERTIQAREEGQAVKLVSAAQIDETGNIAIGGYRINTATGKRSPREIADLAKFMQFLLEGLDKLVDHQAKKPKQSA